MQRRVGGKTRNLKVAALYRPDGQHIGGRVSFMLPPDQLRKASRPPGTAVHISTSSGCPRWSVHCSLHLSHHLCNQHRHDVLSNRIEERCRPDHVRGAFSCRLPPYSRACSDSSASSIASARFRRMREAVVLKTLGATRMRIVRTYSVEFSVLGLLAASVGVVFANLLTRVLLRRLEVAFHIDWLAALVALLGTAILATGTGWIASYRILGLRPLEVLREE